MASDASSAWLLLSEEPFLPGPAGWPAGLYQPYKATHSLPGAGAARPRGLLLLEFSLKGFIKICMPYMNNSPFWCRCTDPHTRRRLLMT